ncbi:hypothetical protein [Chelativorans sp. YIM 93263]|uniref:hypothetical protein n=1 Tax=Chelativorans sp. YIM 93263 TaxID=2906648 RepID=UPI002379D239|nr:hypothetical protein [Chelativorans sp. YIM 93263]
MSIMQGWNEYQPSKGVLAWTAVGASVLTMIVGFTWGGWVTGGTAQERADAAAETATTELASSICVENFRTFDTARAQYQEITDLSSFRRRQFVEEAEWAKLPNGEPVDRQTASLCAQQIADLDPDTLPDAVAVTAEEPDDQDSVVQ